MFYGAMLVVGCFNYWSSEQTIQFGQEKQCIHTNIYIYTNVKLSYTVLYSSKRPVKSSLLESETESKYGENC